MIQSRFGQWLCKGDNAFNLGILITGAPLVALILMGFLP